MIVGEMNGVGVGIERKGVTKTIMTTIVLLAVSVLLHELVHPTEATMNTDEVIGIHPMTMDHEGGIMIVGHLIAGKETIMHIMDDAPTRDLLEEEENHPLLRIVEGDIMTIMMTTTVVVVVDDEAEVPVPGVALVAEGGEVTAAAAAVDRAVEVLHLDKAKKTLL